MVNRGHKVNEVYMPVPEPTWAELVKLTALDYGPRSLFALEKRNECDEDGTARLWDLSAKDPAANPVVLRGHDREVVAVAISPDSRWLVTGSRDGTARLWDLSAWQ